LEITEKNCRVADKIIEILVNEKCTIEETQDILSAVTREVRRTSTVQMGKKFSETYYE
jgi:cell division GTPase FtsZ